jgi:hypothetical protein
MEVASSYLTDILLVSVPCYPSAIEVGKVSNVIHKFSKGNRYSIIWKFICQGTFSQYTFQVILGSPVLLYIETF